MLLAALTASAAASCSHLVYMPSKNVVDAPREMPEDLWFHTSDGVRLHGWWLEAHGARRGTVVQFHGNAGNITSHFAQLEWVTRHGYDLFTFDYRGYGRSEGVPSQAGLNRDARAALALARTKSAKGMRPDLVLYGQSLGGAVLLRALADEPDRSRIRSVIVEGTFNSYREAAASVMYQTPAGLAFAGFAFTVIDDDYAPAQHVASLSPTPLLVIHDQDDPVIPFDFGRAIFRAARQPKDLWPLRTGGHLTARDEPGFEGALLDWLDDPRPLR